MNGRKDEGEFYRDFDGEAEDHNNPDPALVAQMPPDEIQKLVRQLNSQQTELELQNQELKRSHEELIGARDQYSDLFDSAPLGYVITDVQGLVLEANLTVASLLGVDRKLLLNQPLAAFVHPDDQELFSRHRRQIGQGGPFKACRLRLRQSEGKFLWTEMNSNLVGDPGTGDIQLRTAIMDVTPLCETEEATHQLQRLESLGNMAGGLAHHLNNILQIVVGNTQLVMDSLEVGSPDHQYLKKAVNGALRGSSLIGQLLDFSKPASTDSKILAVPRLLDETLVMLKSILPPQVALEMTVDQECGLVSGRPTELQQVLINLCTNSFQAMPESGGTIRITLEELSLPMAGDPSAPELPAGCYARITVGDDGSGMSEDILQHAFEPFFSTKGPFVGAGLGLYSVYGIMTNHQGAVRITSWLDEGTEAQLYLPVCDSSPRMGDPLPAESWDQDNKPRILFVDDEQAIVELVRMQLVRKGFDVTCCLSGTEALAAFLKDPQAFDLVITDQSMPHMNGRLLAENITRARPGIPVILMSGLVSGIDEVRNQAAGIVKFVNKPASANTLESAIFEVMNGSKPSS